jgi:hypothetical protein
VGDTNGQYVSRSDDLRLVTDDDVDTEVEPRPDTRRGIAWWVVVLLVINTITLASMSVNMHFSNAVIRRELDENAALIKQLQELQTVRELSKLKGTP